jgi:hypothetical protein
MFTLPVPSSPDFYQECRPSGDLSVDALIRRNRYRAPDQTDSGEQQSRPTIFAFGSMRRFRPPETQARPVGGAAGFGNPMQGWKSHAKETLTQ